MILQNKTIRGYPVMKKGTKVILGVIGVLIIGGVIGANSGKNSDKPQKTGEVSETQKTEKTTATAAKSTFSVGDIVETKNLRISYLSCGEYKSDNQFLQPKDGNMFIYCEFEFENISDSDQLASSFDFNCFADNTSCDENYFGDESLSANISSGRKAKGKIYYEVPKNAKNIEIEYDANWLTSEKIIFLYK